MMKPQSQTSAKVATRAAVENGGIVIAMLLGPLALWLAFAAISTIDIASVAQTLTVIGVYLPSAAIG